MLETLVQYDRSPENIGEFVPSDWLSHLTNMAEVSRQSKKKKKKETEAASSKQSFKTVDLNEYSQISES